MSTNLLPGQQVAGDDDAFQQFVRDEIQKAVATKPGDQQTQQQQTQATPVKLKLDGKEFTFNSEAERDSALQNFVEQQRQAQAQMQAQLQQLQTKPGKQVSGDDDKDNEPKFDFQTYVDKMAKDPLEAADYMDRARFGFNPVKQLKKLRKMEEKFEQQERLIAALQFKEAHPDYPANPQTAYVLEQIRSSMNLAFDADGLDAAYAIGVQRGLIQPVRQDTQETSPYADTVNNAPTFGQPDNPYARAPQNNWQSPQAPPRVNRQAQDTGGDIVSNFENLSLEQMEQVIRQLEGRAR